MYFCLPASFLLSGLAAVAMFTGQDECCQALLSALVLWALILRGQHVLAFWIQDLFYLSVGRGSGAFGGDLNGGSPNEHTSWVYLLQPAGPGDHAWTWILT